MNLTRSALAPLLDDDCLAIGDHTYGVPIVHRWHQRSARLTIGRYCSIAGGVDILLGGNHRTDWITTSPLPAFYGRTPEGQDLGSCEADGGDVSIGNDVWIGQNVMILPGVSIGDGAVIGASAVVSADVPPYAVLVGNPGRVVRKRFPDATIERLLRLRWWDWADAEVAARADLLLSGDVDALLALPAGQGPGGAVARKAALRVVPPAAPDAAALYVDLLIKSITNSIYRDPNHGPWRARDYDAEARHQGADWPQVAHSMIGVLRLANLAELTRTVLREGIAGDLIETGVWRGGACILMRGVLKAHGDTTRTVYVADSFQGLPPPDAHNYPADAGQTIHTEPFLAVSQENVAENFRSYGLLDAQVAFLPGWFKDTLPNLQAPAFAIIRLDGDLYESTIQALDALYPKLSIGGFVIVDDYGSWPVCRQAVEDYRAAHAIVDPIVPIDSTGIYWRRTR